MKRIRLLAATALSVVWAASALAAPPSSHELLRRVYDRYAEMDAYGERASLTIDLMGRRSEDGIVYARRRPLAVYAASPDGMAMTIISDGSHRWEYAAGLKEYTEDRVADLWPWDATDIEAVTLGLGPPRIGVPLQSPVIAHWLMAGRPFVDHFASLPPATEDTLDNRPVWVVEMPLPSAYGLTIRYRVYIGRDDSLIHRSEVEYRVAAADAGSDPLLSARADHRDIQVDDAVPADRFRFEPPAAARRVGWLHYSGLSPKATAMIGKPAPPFEGRDLAGNEFALADFRGHPVLLFWWATSCGPCRLELPHLDHINRLAREQGLRVLGIDIDENEKLVRDFVEKQGLSFPIMIARGRDLLAKYPCKLTPFFVLIDAEGVVYELGSGYKEPQRLIAALEGIGVKLPQPTPRELAEQAGLHRLEALKAYLAGEDSAALDALRAAAEADPKSADPWVWRGAYYLARGDVEEAKSAFSRAEQTDPKDAGARTEMARHYLTAGVLPEEAVRLAKDAVKLAGVEVQPRAVLAEAYLTTRQPEEAIKLLTLLEKQLPGDGGVKFLLGSAHEQNGDKQAALTAYRAAQARGYPAAAAAVARLGK